MGFLAKEILSFPHVLECLGTAFVKLHMGVDKLDRYNPVSLRALGKRAAYCMLDEKAPEISDTFIKTHLIAPKIDGLSAAILEGIVEQAGSQSSYTAAAVAQRAAAHPTTTNIFGIHFAAERIAEERQKFTQLLAIYTTPENGLMYQLNLLCELDALLTNNQMNLTKFNEFYAEGYAVTGQSSVIIDDYRARLVRFTTEVFHDVNVYIVAMHPNGRIAESPDLINVFRSDLNCGIADLKAAPESALHKLLTLQYKCKSLKELPVTLYLEVLTNLYEAFSCNYDTQSRNDRYPLIVALNHMGIDLLRAGRYEDAKTYLSKASYLACIHPLYDEEIPRAINLRAIFRNYYLALKLADHADNPKKLAQFAQQFWYEATTTTVNPYYLDPTKFAKAVVADEKQRLNPSAAHLSQSMGTAVLASTSATASNSASIAPFVGEVTTVAGNGLKKVVS